MNKSLLFSLIGLIVLSTGYSALTDNLKAYYNFDETTGTTLYDILDYADGTNNGADINQYAKVGKSYLFVRASSDNVNLSNPSLDNFYQYIQSETPFTISALINRVSSDHMTIFSRSTSSGAGFTFFIESNQLVFEIVKTWGTYHLRTYCNSTTLPSTNGSWTLLTATYNGNKSTSGVTMYINGIACTSYNPSNNNLNGNYTLATKETLIGKGGSAGAFNGYIDELGLWTRVLSSSEVLALNSSYALSVGYPFISDTSNQNVTLITDNTTGIYSNASSSYFVEFNSTQSFLFRAYNSSGFEVIQNLTISSVEAGISATNFTSGVNKAITFNNASATIYVINVTNPFNSSVWKTINVYIDEIESITMNSSSQRFFKYNSSIFLSFFGNHSFGLINITCNDNINLTIPLLNITNRLVPLCTNSSVTFNNSAVYNYTVYVTHNERGQNISNIYNFYTNAYNLSIASYNSTIANNSLTDIYWYLTTTPNYLNSSQSYNMSINFNGSTTYPIASILNYSYLALQRTNKLIETIPFYLIFNLTFANESLLFNNSYNLTITTIQLDNCVTYTRHLMNISLKDEIVRANLVSNSSLTAYFNINDALLPLNINDSDGFIPICINNSANFYADVDFQFYADGWGAVDKTTREHFYRNYYFTNTTTTQSFFMLNQSIAQKVKFTVYDANEIPVADYFVVVKRWYGDGYETVAMAKTDVSGQAFTYIQYLDAYYAIDILNTEGVMVYSKDKNVIGEVSNILRIENVVGEDYLSIYQNVTYSYIFNNLTNVFTAIISNDAGNDIFINVLVNDLNGSIVCNNYYFTPSVTSPCLVYTNATFRATSYVYVGGKYVNLFSYYFTTKTHLDYGKSGVVYSLFMLFLAVSVGAYINGYLIPIMFLSCLMLCSALGWIYISTQVLIGLAFAVGIIYVFVLRGISY